MAYLPDRIGALVAHKLISDRLGDHWTVLASLTLLGCAMLGYAILQSPLAWLAIPFFVGVVFVTNNTTVEVRRAVAIQEKERGYSRRRTFS